MTVFLDKIKLFIKETSWIFAKTYASTWPHEYIVEEKVDNKLFIKLADHIDTYGHEEYFYKKKMIYLEYDGQVYWHMDNIINRCLPEETYSRRKAENRLP